MPKHAKKPPSQRQLKVGEEIRHILSSILMRGDLYDYGGKDSLDVTVSQVSVSPDLRNATVYIMPLAGKDKEGILEILNNIAPKLRHSIGKQIRIRHLPKLRFELDYTFDEGQKIDNLLRDMSSKELVDK